MTRSGRFVLDPGVRVLVHALSLSWARVTRRAGLPADLLSAGPAQLDTAAYYAFWSALAEEGESRALVVDIGAAVSAEMFSPPLIAALSSPDLRVAATRIATYKPLIGPLDLDVGDTPARLTVTCCWPDPAPPPLLAMSELVFWVALARLGTRHPVRPVQVTRPGPVRDDEALETYLGCRVRRGDGYSVSFTGVDADRRFLTENDAMWQMFAPELGRRLAELDATATVSDRVRAALYETLPAGDSSITAVTRRLAVSPRTLQRQLLQEGTSFQRELARTRTDLAHQYLHHSTLRTTEIAYLLGYDDSNSFYRAFRTWTGSTPDAVRADGPTPSARGGRARSARVVAPQVRPRPARRAQRSRGAR